MLLKNMQSGYRRTGHTKNTQAIYRGGRSIKLKRSGNLQDRFYFYIQIQKMTR